MQRYRVVKVGIGLALGVLLIGLQTSASTVAPNERASSKTQNDRAKPKGQASADRPIATSRPTTQPTTRPAATRPAEAGKSEIVAYYFHRTLRCPSCQHIEALAKQTIEKRFANEVKAGLLRWQDVDMQEKGNEHFATDYKLDAPSLVLVRMASGQQVAWKNCEKVWDLHQNERKFTKYVQGEIAAMLKSAAPTPAKPARK